ncbi:MAG: HAD family phosphatase [Selenomonadaceae bacterium]|nr:HAD family phosphatase [Selenomonadaceae bacterium]
MAIKLFVTDLDGTLLPAGKDVPEANRLAAQKAVAQGVVVTIATGRMYKAALPVAKSLEVDVPIITFNGALIKSVQGKVYYASYIAPELVREALDFCRKQDWHVNLYSGDELYYAEHNQYAQEYEINQAIHGAAIGWEGMRAKSDEVAKLLSIADSREETDRRVALLQEKFAGRLNVFSSTDHYTEIVNPGVTKASGIARLAEKLGVSIEETMAIGDGDNDIPMLKAVGKSVAMGNATPEVKAVCDYETDVCEANGFAKAIEKYVLA